MRGNEEIVKLLNEVLKAELTAINQYFLHAKMCENWGYQRLAALDRQESIEEMNHADILMQRILFLEGMPNMTELFPIKVGPDVKTQLENDLALELDAVPRLNEAIKVATTSATTDRASCSNRSCWTRSITSIIWKGSSTSSKRSAWIIIWRSRFIRPANPKGCVRNARGQDCPATHGRQPLPAVSRSGYSSRRARN